MMGYFTTRKAFVHGVCLTLSLFCALLAQLPLEASPAVVTLKPRSSASEAPALCRNVLASLPASAPTSELDNSAAAAKESSESCLLGSCYIRRLISAEDIQRGIFRLFYLLSRNLAGWHQQPVEVFEDGSPALNNNHLIPVTFSIEHIKSIFRDKLDFERTNRMLNIIKSLLFKSLEKRGLRPVMGGQDYKNSIFLISPDTFDPKLIEEATAEALQNFSERFLKRRFPELYKVWVEVKGKKSWISAGFDLPDDRETKPSVNAAYIASHFMNDGEVFVSFETKKREIENELIKMEELRKEILKFFQDELGKDAVEKGPFQRVSVFEREVEVLRPEVNQLLRKISNLKDLNYLLRGMFGVQRDLSLDLLVKIVSYYNAAQTFQPPHDYPDAPVLATERTRDLQSTGTSMPALTRAVVAVDQSGVGANNSTTIQAQLAALISAQLSGDEPRLEIRQILSRLNYLESVKRMKAGLEIFKSALTSVAERFQLEMQKDLLSRGSGDDHQFFLLREFPIEAWAEVISRASSRSRGTYVSRAIAGNEQELIGEQDIEDLRESGDAASKVLRNYFANEPESRDLKVGTYLRPVRTTEKDQVIFQLTVIASFPPATLPELRERMKAFIRSGRFRIEVQREGTLSDELISRLSPTFGFYEIESQDAP